MLPEEGTQQRMQGGGKEKRQERCSSTRGRWVSVIRQVCILSIYARGGWGGGGGQYAERGNPYMQTGTSPTCTCWKARGALTALREVGGGQGSEGAALGGQEEVSVAIHWRRTSSSPGVCV